MFNITPSEFLIIALLALVVLGPERLPDMAKSLGRLINKARDMTSDLREQVDSISDDPSMKPLKDLGELATRPREKLAEFAAEAEAEDRARRAEEQARISDEADSDEADSDANDEEPGTEQVEEDTTSSADSEDVRTTTETDGAENIDTAAASNDTDATTDDHDDQGGQ